MKVNSEKLKVKSFGKVASLPFIDKKRARSSGHPILFTFHFSPFTSMCRRLEATPAWRALRRGEPSVNVGARALPLLRMCRRHG